VRIALGIDTGGTFTDAVLVDLDGGQVLAGAKALTTRHDLAIGISGAIGNVLAATTVGEDRIQPGDISLVALSTTLATNTIAEGQRASTCLILIGYDAELIEKFNLSKELATDDVVYVSGGHDGLGNEVEPLDEAGARAAILARRNTVEAFAISGYFGVRNPEHEMRVRTMVADLTGLPVTCGHDLTNRLDSVRRATTVALNAHLILPLRELIASVQQTLHQLGIAAPLMVVKGDGSLVRAEWAMQRPIETVLSGPAASLMGAWHLSGRRDMWAVDVGGTTTDIAALRDGWPCLSPDGAVVNGWRTMVEAVDVHTTGLGGDSQVWLDREGSLCAGPRRVVPLALLASENPGIVAVLERAVATPAEHRADGMTEFFTLARRSAAKLDAEEEEILQRLEKGAQSLAALAEQTRHGWLVSRRMAVLEARGLARRAGFTPTDALHVLGRLALWNADAARLGASLLAEEMRLDVEAFCKRVVTTVGRRITEELVSKILADEAQTSVWQNDRSDALLARVLHPDAASDLKTTLTLTRPIVAIGAPVAAYMPDVARYMHTELVIPAHADVANAVGAVAGGIIQRVHTLINPCGDDGHVRLHLPESVSEFESVEQAIQYAEQAMIPYVEQLARSAGAEQVDVHVTRLDHKAPNARDNQDVYLETDLTFTATGRPSLAPQADGSAGRQVASPA